MMATKEKKTKKREVSSAFNYCTNLPFMIHKKTALRNALPQAAILSASEKFLTVNSKGLEESAKEAILIWNLKALSAVPEKKV